MGTEWARGEFGSGGYEDDEDVDDDNAIMVYCENHTDNHEDGNYDTESKNVT